MGGQARYELTVPSRWWQKMRADHDSDWPISDIPEVGGNWAATLLNVTLGEAATIGDIADKTKETPGSLLVSERVGAIFEFGTEATGRCS